MKTIHKLAEFIVTVCFLGKIKYAPGTFGSLAAFPISYLIVYFSATNKITFFTNNFSGIEQQFINLIIIQLLLIFCIFLLGMYFTTIYLKNSESKDPKEVVIDELVGQMLVVVGSLFSIIMLFSTKLPKYIDGWIIDFFCLFLSPFLLFRFFDIIKPWPINLADQNIQGALGVMLDDILAAIFAIVSHYVIVFLIIDLVLK